MFYAVACGEALHIIPADGHDQLADGTLVVHGREEHNYGPYDYDLFIWTDTRDALDQMIGRIRLAPRLQE